MKKIVCLLLFVHSGLMIAQTETVPSIYGKKVQINPFVDNGLTATNGHTQLGGSLIQPTTITASLANTLAIKGLQTGSGFDYIITVNPTTGVLKTINGATFGWNLNGNAGTDPAINFIGTTDNQPLMFRINNSPAGSITTGITTFGYNAFQAGGGVNNTAIGAFALQSNISGDTNTAVGGRALNRNTAGISNTAIGYNALYNNLGGNHNFAGGYNALYNTIGSTTTTGNYNIGVGSFSINANISGSNNIAMGYYALALTTGGSSNVALGYYAGTYYAGIGNNLTSADGSIFIGTNSMAKGNGQNNQIVIGSNAVGRGSNSVQIGDGNMTNIGGQVAWSTPSDVRLKKDIKDSEFGLNFINKLRPVTYKMKTGTTDLQSGFIAQEVESAANSLNYQFSGIVKPQTDADFYSLRYSEFVVPLVKAVQEQQKHIEVQHKMIGERDAEILDIKKRLLQLEQKIK